jgi:hypothetical protein
MINRYGSKKHTCWDPVPDPQHCFTVALAFKVTKTAYLKSSRLRTSESVLNPATSLEKQ